MKTLVIAEKPSVARDIARVLGCSKKENGALELSLIHIYIGKSTFSELGTGTAGNTAADIFISDMYDFRLQMFFVIDSRYRSRRPMIITTNLKLDELKNPSDLAHARIYDRILERCAPILFAGKNFREENAGATKQAAKDIVNRKHE